MSDTQQTAARNGLNDQGQGTEKTQPADPADIGYLDRPGTRKILWLALYGVCAIFAALGVYGAIAHWMHPYFTLDGLPVFYALAGAMGALVLGVGGRLVSQLLMKPADYYDRPADERRPEPSAEGAND